jgi:thymidylate synthase (FAD)
MITNSVGSKIKVLDKGFIKLLDTMPEFSMIAGGYSALDREIANSARASYDKSAHDVERDKVLIKYLIDNHHTSPLEQVELKFQMKAPVVVWWQHVRHRIQEMNIQSGRYTEYKEEEFYVPSSLRKQDARNRQASAEHFQDPELEELIRKTYDASFETYKKLLEAGVAREQARIVLPGFAMYHTGVVKMNLHSFHNYILRRTAEDAQWEIRQFATAAEYLARKTIPFTGEVLWGPPAYELQPAETDAADELKLARLTGNIGNGEDKK